MGWTIENALEDDLLNNIKHSEDTFSFQVGKLKTVITIKIKWNKKYKHFGFRQSHYINTPTQIDAYKTSITHDSDKVHIPVKVYHPFLRKYTTCSSESIPPIPVESIPLF